MNKKLLSTLAPGDLVLVNWDDCDPAVAILLEKPICQERGDISVPPPTH